MRQDVKICSLLPSGTEIVFALGLGEQLMGVSDLCDYPAEAKHKPVVSRSLIDTTVLSSAEVEAKMRALRTAGASLFHIDATVLRQEAPDLVLTHLLPASTLPQAQVLCQCLATELPRGSLT